MPQRPDGLGTDAEESAAALRRQRIQGERLRAEPEGSPGPTPPAADGDERLDREGMDSFPASDPPPTPTHVTRGCGPMRPPA